MGTAIFIDGVNPFLQGELSTGYCIIGGFLRLLMVILLLLDVWRVFGRIRAA
jgi:hypothetical protein